MLCVWAALVCRPCVATEVGSVVRLRLREAEGRLSSLIHVGRHTRLCPIKYEKERDVITGVLAVSSPPVPAYHLSLRVGGDGGRWCTSYVGVFWSTSSFLVVLVVGVVTDTVYRVDLVIEETREVTYRIYRTVLTVNRFTRTTRRESERLIYRTLNTGLSRGA